MIIGQKYKITIDCDTKDYVIGYFIGYYFYNGYTRIILANTAAYNGWLNQYNHSDGLEILIDVISNIEKIYEHGIRVQDYKNRYFYAHRSKI